MDNLKQKVHDAGKKAAERIKALPANAKEAVKEFPAKSREVAAQAVSALTEMQRRTRVKLIVAAVVLILFILTACGVFSGGHLWYTKKI